MQGVAKRTESFGYEASVEAIQRLDGLAVDLQAQLQQAQSVSEDVVAPGYCRAACLLALPEPCGLAWARGAALGVCGDVAQCNRLHSVSARTAHSGSQGLPCQGARCMQGAMCSLHLQPVPAF